jgi:hypothetical protein
MNWFDELKERMHDAFFKVHNEEDCPTAAFADYHFDDGSFLEVELHKKNNVVDVYYYHAYEKVDRDCPNITQYIEDNLPDWDEYMEQYEDAYPEDEWQAHGFDNEADYWHYRLG